MRHVMYGALPPLGAVGAGGASALSALSVRRQDAGFQALATVVAVTTLIMAGASLRKLLPAGGRFAEATVAWRTSRRTTARTDWIAVP
ncbi:hypothetical protein ACWCZ5_18480 [Streptomyces sp. NPDC001667]